MRSQLHTVKHADNTVRSSFRRLSGIRRIRVEPCGHARRHLRLRCRAQEDLSIVEIEARLKDAISKEDYATAARLRDLAESKKLDNALAVEYANNRFYRAFENLDIKEMEALWSKGDHVQVVHPEMLCIAGSESVLKSWSLIFSNMKRGLFTLRIQDVRVWANDNTGFVTCVECLDSQENRGRVVATNVFERVDGEWKMMLHHGSSAPSSVDGSYNP